MRTATKMNNTIFITCDILYDNLNNKRWRIIQVYNAICTLIELDTKKMKLTQIAISDLENAIFNNNISLIRNENLERFDFDNLSDTTKDQIKKAMAIINDLLNLTRDFYWFASREKGDYITEIANKHGV